MKKYIFFVAWSILFVLLQRVALADGYNYKINQLVDKLVRGVAGTPIGKLTVINFVESPSNIRRSFSKILELDITQKLIQNKHRNFSIVDVNRQDILKEIKKQGSTIYDPQNSAKFGRLLGADAIITGTYRKVNNMFIIYAQLISVATGEALYGAETMISFDELPNKDIIKDEGKGKPSPPKPPTTQFFLNSPPYFGIMGFQQLEVKYRRFWGALKLPHFIASMFGFGSSMTRLSIGADIATYKPWESLLADYAPISDNPLYSTKDQIDLQIKEKKLQFFMYLGSQFPTYINYSINNISYINPLVAFDQEVKKISWGIGIPEEQTFFSLRYAHKLKTEFLYIEADMVPVLSGLHVGYKFSLSRLFSPYLKASYRGYRWDFETPHTQDFTHFRIFDLVVGSDVKLFYRLRGYAAYKYQQFHFIAAQEISGSDFDNIFNDAEIKHRIKRNSIILGILLMF